MPHKSEKSRLDERLVALGLAPTRAKAKALVMAGAVRVGGKRVDKAGTPVAEDAEIAVETGAGRYASRGGLKLEGALEDLGVDPAGLVCLDVGA
ncbi:MAG: TlyA family RNA methyltransferase, partial [Candidatus Methylomirabilis sp.]|nr:TlyA family RNA methyltransferase [Deltaproteobacteria bacterium]